MFITTLEVLSQPMPAADDLAEWHEWSLKMGKGTAMLIRYFWNAGSLEDKDNEEVPIENTNKVLQNNTKIVAVGFDVLQVPRYKVVYQLDTNHN